MTTNQIEILAIVSVLINVTLLCFTVWYNRRLQKEVYPEESPADYYKRVYRKNDDRNNYEVLADVRAAFGCSYEEFFKWVAQLHSRGFAGRADIDHLRRMGVPISKWIFESMSFDYPNLLPDEPYPVDFIEAVFKEKTGPNTKLYRIHQRQKEAGFTFGSSAQAYEAEFLSVWEDELIRTGVIDGPIFGKTDERKNGSV